MKHRERVLTALHHEDPDRCPMQISFTPEFASRLKHELKLADEDFHNPHGRGNTYVMERTLDEDMLLTSVGWANSYYATDAYSEDGVTYADEWGVNWRNHPYQTRFGTGHYTEIAEHRMAAYFSTLKSINPDLKEVDSDDQPEHDPGSGLVESGTRGHARL